MSAGHTEEHGELAGLRLEVVKTLAEPARVLDGRVGSLLARREIQPGKDLVAAYRELEHDGFVIARPRYFKLRAPDLRDSDMIRRFTQISADALPRPRNLRRSASICR